MSNGIKIMATSTWIKLNKNAVIASRDFAKNMTTGNGYVHAVRRGGEHVRQRRDKFWDTFQGKLAECAFYGLGLTNGIKIEKPDFTVGGAGYIDNGDFIIQDKHISIKSGRPNASYLLLETHSFNKDGYETTFETPLKNDAFCFIKVAWKDKENKFSFINKIPQDLLYTDEVADNIYIYFAGFLSFERFQSVVHEYYRTGKSSCFIKKGDPIGRTGVKMDADNYIFQNSNLVSMNELWYYLKLKVKD